MDPLCKSGTSGSRFRSRQRLRAWPSLSHRTPQRWAKRQSSSFSAVIGQIGFARAAACMRKSHAEDTYTRYAARNVQSLVRDVFQRPHMTVAWWNAMCIVVSMLLDEVSNGTDEVSDVRDSKESM